MLSKLFLNLKYIWCCFAFPSPENQVLWDRPDSREVEMDFFLLFVLKAAFANVYLLCLLPLFELLLEGSFMSDKLPK